MVSSALSAVSHLIAGATEASLTGLVVQEGTIEVFSPKVGPVEIAEVELRIGELPEEVVADPTLPTGADQKIGIGKVRQIEMSGDVAVGDRLIVAASLSP